jgi:nucleoid-associated protein YgaU
MGRLEKIVVFTVLFLVAVILGVSLSTDPAESTPPLADATKTPGGGPGGRRAAREEAQRQAPEGVMSTSLAERGANGAAPVDASAPLVNNMPNNTLGNAAPTLPASLAANPLANPLSGGGATQSPAVPVNAPVNAQPVQPAPQQAPTAFLVSREGLKPTASDEFMVYTWQAGDSFSALAQRFYGSPLHVKRIRDANEGRDEAKLVAGESLLICAQATADSDRIARPSARDAKSTAAAGVVGGTYTVGAGDVLGTISQKVYGTASKWRKIYDANRDVIGADPNQLKPGMMLRIPQ